MDKLLEKHRQASASLLSETRALEKINTDLSSVLDAQRIVQQVAQAMQQKAHERIAGVVTRCLNAVFDNPYEFRIRFDKKRGKTEAVLTFIRDGMSLDEPMEEVGGGVIDVAALALRLACIMLTRPASRRILVLDEPFSQVRGQQNKARTRAMLMRLCDDIGVQVIINTDIAEYQLGTVIELE